MHFYLHWITKDWGNVAQLFRYNLLCLYSRYSYVIGYKERHMWVTDVRLVIIAKILLSIDIFNILILAKSQLNSARNFGKATSALIWYILPDNWKSPFSIPMYTALNDLWGHSKEFSNRNHSWSLILLNWIMGPIINYHRSETYSIIWPSETSAPIILFWIPFGVNPFEITIPFFWTKCIV